MAESIWTQRSGIINGQGILPYSQQRVGLGTVAKNGCTMIAVYNALQMLGFPRSLGEILQWYRRGFHLLAFGFWGATPWSMGAFFRSLGIRVRGSRSCDQLTAAPEEGSIFVFTVMNSRNPLRGFHAMSAKFTDGLFEVYNVYSDDTDCRRVRSLKEAFPRGVWIYGYRVEA